MSGQLIGQRMPLSCPQEVGGLPTMGLIREVFEMGAELEGQGRAHQPYWPCPIITGVVEPPRAWMHEQSFRPEWRSQLIPAPTEWKLLRGTAPFTKPHPRQQVGEYQGPVITAQEVPLPPAQSQEGKLILIAAGFVGPQTGEEEDQELFICTEDKEEKCRLLLRTSLPR